MALACRTRRSPIAARPATATIRRPRRVRYDRRAAERYWGEERPRLGDELRIVLSAGEPPWVNAAYHTWETTLLERHLRPRRGQCILDVACGLGRIAAPLARTGATVVGVDNALGMVRAAAAKTARAPGSKSRGLPRDAGRAVRPAFAHAFSGSLPFMDASFDAVICLGLFEHIPPWLQATTLREMLRVARRGGAIYLMLLNNRSLLLQAGRDNRHRRARQLPNGYYCGLPDRDAIVARLRDSGAGVTLLGSNAHYAILRHALHDRSPRPAEARRATRAFADAARRDLSDPHQEQFGEMYADHFFYHIVRR